MAFFNSYVSLPERTVLVRNETEAFDGGLCPNCWTSRSLGRNQQSDLWRIRICYDNHGQSFLQKPGSSQSQHSFRKRWCLSTPHRQIVGIANKKTNNSGKNPNCVAANFLTRRTPFWWLFVASNNAQTSITLHQTWTIHQHFQTCPKQFTIYTYFNITSHISLVFISKSPIFGPNFDTSKGGQPPHLSPGEALLFKDRRRQAQRQRGRP